MLQYQKFCVSDALRVRLWGIRDSSAIADIICWQNHSYFLRNVCQYIFPTLCNTLYNYITKLNLEDIRCGVSLCMGLCKQVTKKTMKDTEYLKQPETIKRFSKLIRDNAVYFKSHFFKKSFLGCSVVNNVFKP